MKIERGAAGFRLTSSNLKRKIAHDWSRVVGDYFLFRHAITIAITIIQIYNSANQNNHIFSRNGIPTRSNAFFMTCSTISQRQTRAFTRAAVSALRIWLSWYQ